MSSRLPIIQPGPAIPFPEELRGEGQRVHFVSLGCPKNRTDSEVMLARLGGAGYELTDAADDADVIVVNTCTFIDAATTESVETVLEMAELKARGKARKLVVSGCMAQRHHEALKAELPEVDSLWVMPHMGDGGLAAGAALGSAGATPRRLAHACLGPTFGRRDCSKALERAQLPREEVASRQTLDGVPGDVERVAAVIAGGGAVGRFHAAMEWGPRALGHRSVLAPATDPAVNEWLNERLSRSEFMPFAPVVRAEDAPGYFVGLDKADDAARFMTVCFDCTDTFKKLAPAAVHVDGTARPQVVSASSDPDLHALLTRVGELTGVPVLINTSFNLHEEPIVCTPDDGVRAFVQAKLDALWMAPYVVIRPRFGASSGS